MIKILRALLLLMAFTLPATADETPPTPEEPSEAAMQFVEGFSDDHLSGMLSRIGARQAPMIALSQLDGQMVAAVFDLEIDKAVERHGAEWKRNMARAWTPLLTDEELTSLATDGVASPYTDKYVGLRQEAGQRMQVLSQDLFRQILSEVIQNTVEELSETPAAGGEATGEGGETGAPEKSD